MKAKEIGALLLKIAKRSADTAMDQVNVQKNQERHKDMTLSELKAEKSQMARDERGQSKSRARRDLEQTAKDRESKKEQAQAWLVDNQKDTPEYLAKIIQQKPSHDPYTEAAKSLLNSQSIRGSQAATDAMDSLRASRHW